MRYFVIAPDGNRYGPADVQTLSSWAQQNRLQPNSMLQDETSGQRVIASAVPGIFGAPAGYAPSAPIIPPVPGTPLATPMTPMAPAAPINPAVVGNQYQNSPSYRGQMRPGAYQSQVGSQDAKKQAWSSIGFAVIAPILGFISYYGIFLALAGVGTGWKAYQAGNRLGIVGIVLNVIAVPAALVARFFRYVH